MTQSSFVRPLRSKSLPIPTFKSITLLDPDEIIYVQAMQNYSMLYTQDGSRILSSLSFGKMLEQLDFYGFYQCHKSYAIKVNRVVRYLKNGMVELTGDILVPIARRRRKDFKNLIMA